MTISFIPVYLKRFGIYFLMHSNGAMYNKRSRGQCYFVIIFQIVFICLQVFVFYPCWQRAPGSTIYGVFRKSQGGSVKYDSESQLSGKHFENQDKVSNTGLGNANVQHQIQEEGFLPPKQGAAQQIPDDHRDDHVADDQDGQLDGQKTANKNPPVGQQQQQPGQEPQVSTQEKQQLDNQQKIMYDKQQHLSQQRERLTQSVRYNPNWESLDSRPVPEWYETAKIGIFIHWGVYSVPSYVGIGTKGLAEWFWLYWRNNDYVKPLDEYHSQRYDSFIQRKQMAIDSVRQFMDRNYPIKWTYRDFAREFKAEFFDPKHWAKVFQESGAKYVVLTSKHHDGYALWPSKHSWNWNSGDLGPHRDLVGELGTAVREKGLHYGLYHSLYEWFNPMYTKDKKNKFTTQEYVQKKLMPELREIVEKYNPEVLWSDGQFEAPCSYWNCTDFLAWLFNDSPVRETVVTNDRWGTDVLCTHGSFLTCEDRYNPADKQSRKWESCITIDQESWGYRRNARLEDYYTIEGLIELLAQTVSKGGNLLMNIGPTAFGTIPPIFEERLKQMGEWLKINGGAIYETTAWSTPRDPNNKNVYYTLRATSEGPVVYAIFTVWPAEDRLELAAPKPSSQTTVTWVGYSGPLIPWTSGPNGGIILNFPKVSINAVPSRWAWVVCFKKLINAID